MSDLQLQVAQTHPTLLSCFTALAPGYAAVMEQVDVSNEEKFYNETSMLQAKTWLSFLYFIVLENIRRMLPNRSNKDF
jgi:hypothetical protein